MSSEHMRSHLRGLAATSVLALSATMANANERVFYLEGMLGFSFPQDVSTETYTGTAFGVIDFDDASLVLDYEDAITYGAEYGMYLSESVRLGFSIQSIAADLQKIKGTSGTATLDGTVYDLTTLSVSRSDYVGAGFDGDDLETKNGFFSVNAYYDLPASGKLRPFMGLGLGAVDFENAPDNEFAASLYAGARYFYQDNAYAGIKLGAHRISGPEDELGVQYEDFNVFTAAATIGFEF